MQCAPRPLPGPCVSRGSSAAPAPLPCRAPQRPVVAAGLPLGARCAAARARAGVALRTLRGAMSSRRRTNTGARSAPAGVHSPKVTSATSSGLSQVVGRCSGGFCAKGERRAFELRGALEEHRNDLVVEPRADVPGIAQRACPPSTRAAARPAARVRPCRGCSRRPAARRSARP